MKDNPCVKFDYIDRDGQPVYKNKLCFDTDVEAIAYAKKLNADSLIRKLVAYKCPKCLKWHVGRTNVMLSDKEREKIKNA